MNEYYASKPEPLQFERKCGSCNECCKWLYYVINGHVKHPGKPCFYLGDNCTVHEIRPQSCRDYHCAYIQGILPEWMKPSLSKVLVNVEKWGPNKEYNMLRAIECGKKIDSEYLSWLIQYSRNTNTGLIYQLSGVWNYFGPDAFMEFFKDQIMKAEFENPFINVKSDDILKSAFVAACKTPGDINEHLPLFDLLAKKCKHITEFGVRWGTSTTAWLNNDVILRAYDIESNLEAKKLFELAKNAGKDAQYIIADTTKIESIEETDLLFIDSYHTQKQTLSELRFANKVKKYIVFHDTVTFGETGEDGGPGILHAIREFLNKNNDWVILDQRTNCNGIMVLTRKDLL